MKRPFRIIMAICVLLGLVGCNRSSEQVEIKTFTAFMAVPGKVIPDDNRMMNKIAKKIGAKAQVSWLENQTVEERIKVMIASGKYPDFIDGTDATALLMEAKALIPLDEYMDDYPNIKNYLSEEQWNQLRQEDGHIYVIPQFGVIQGESKSVTYHDEAFWIQKRVLEWAGYPRIKTLDEYFDLIEAYLEAEPGDPGKENIGFEILCDDWRFFCLENPPQFLAGYPNDGCAIVDPQTKQVSVYDTIPEAKQYYKRLCREYNLGVIDPESFTMSYEQYLEKISSGRVLGIADQYWQFLPAVRALIDQGMYECTYVPLGIVANENITDRYYSDPVPTIGRGIGITVSCQDIEGAMQFLNDLLEEEIMIMRQWGEKGIDYEIDKDGIFYRTEEWYQSAEEAQWYNKNMCSYYYFPHYEGTMKDGINALSPNEQKGEYYAALPEIDRRILEAYGYEKWSDFLAPPKKNEPWFPLYSALNTGQTDAPYMQAKRAMDEVKHEWLPKVIMAAEKDFEQTWKTYMEVYEEKVDVEAYEKELTEEVKRRIAVAEGKNQP